jgi:hypothetical protein
MTEISKLKVDREECLVQYKNHMEKVRGLALETQRSYQLIARRFLESLSPNGGSSRRGSKKLNQIAQR